MCKSSSTARASIHVAHCLDLWCNLACINEWESLMDHVIRSMRSKLSGSSIIGLPVDEGRDHQWWRESIPQSRDQSLEAEANFSRVHTPSSCATNISSCAFATAVLAQLIIAHWILQSGQHKNCATAFADISPPYTSNFSVWRSYTPQGQPWNRVCPSPDQFS